MVSVSNLASTFWINRSCLDNFQMRPSLHIPVMDITGIQFRGGKRLLIKVITLELSSKEKHRAIHKLGIYSFMGSGSPSIMMMLMIY